MASFLSGLSERLDMESLLPGSGQDQGYRGEQLLSEDDNDTAAQTGGEDGSQEPLCSMCSSLTWQERLGGCLGCMALGYILSFGSFFRFKDLMMGDPAPFVVYATVGNIISLSGSFFLSGPTSQFKKMFHESRKTATLLYLGSLAVTLIVALIPFGSGVRGIKAMILVILLLCQYVAVAWYCMSYIPFARQMITRLFNRIWSRIEEWD